MFRSKCLAPLIFKIKEQLFHCAQNNIQVTLVWIPGHSGIQGNEQVDIWAKDAVLNGSPSYSIYATDILPLASKNLSQDWQSYFNESATSKGRFYFNIQNTIPPRLWFFKRKVRTFDKYVISTICRLRFGHVCNPVFLNKIRIKDSSLCECGLDEGTPDHIFFGCQKYPVSLYEFLPPSIPRPLNLNYLLTLSFSSSIQYLCKYISMYVIKL